MISFNNPVTEVLFIVLLLSWWVQLMYYWVSYRRLAFYREDKDPENNPPVSVIICAKNEALNLRKNLGMVLEQAYPSFEVIVVNDCSWDETGSYLEEMALKYSHLKVVNIQEQEKYRHGKKFALTLGIKAAQHEILLLTDADCRPSGSNWISHFQSHFTEGTEIVLGYGAIRRRKGFLNRLIRYDGFCIAMQYLSFALGGNAYMGVGRNLAYRKSLFFRNKGFANHYHLFSGDDDLFVNENATSKNTKIDCHPDAFTYTEAKESFGEWMNQKRRHMGTSKYYKFRHKLQLFFSWFSNFSFYGLLIALLCLRFDWRILVSLYGGYLLLRLPVLWKCSHRLKENDLSWLFPFLEPLHLLLQPLFFLSNLFTKQKAWK